MGQRHTPGAAAERMRTAPALSAAFLFVLALALAPTPARARTPCVPGVPAQLQQAGCAPALQLFPCDAASPFQRVTLVPATNAAAHVPGAYDWGRAYHEIWLS